MTCWWLPIAGRHAVEWESAWCWTTTHVTLTISTAIKTNRICMTLNWIEFEKKKKKMILLEDHGHFIVMPLTQTFNIFGFFLFWMMSSIEYLFECYFVFSLATFQRAKCLVLFICRLKLTGLFEKKVYIQFDLKTDNLFCSKSFNYNILNRCLERVIIVCSQRQFRVIPITTDSVPMQVNSFISIWWQSLGPSTNLGETAIFAIFAERVFISRIKINGFGLVQIN